MNGTGDWPCGLSIMIDIVALLRIGLQGLSLGVFCLYWSCMGVPISARAIVYLGTAAAIVLAVQQRQSPATLKYARH
jgi:hypothetical protein